MKSKSVIDLNLIPNEGSFFSFDASEIKELPEFVKVSEDNPENKIEFNLTPLGSGHYEMKISLYLKRPLNCSRCGEEFSEWFDKKVTEYLSTNTQDEGEDKGFEIVPEKAWNWAEFVYSVIELETPYQTLKYGKKCLSSCENFDKVVNQGLVIPEDPQNPAKPSSPFAALKDLKLPR